MIRRRFHNLSIASKLRVIITGACIIVAVATGMALMIAEYALVRSRLLNAQTTRAAMLSLSAAPTLTFQSREDAEEVLRTTGAQPDALAAAIFDLKGAEFARFIARPGEEPLPPPVIDEFHHVFTARDLTIWTPLEKTNGHRVGTLALRVSLNVLYERLAIFGLVCVGVVLAATVLALILSQVLQGTLSQPVQSLAAAADRVTQTRDFSVRVPHASPDELGQLAAAFNFMLGAVQSAQGELEAKVEERTKELQQAYRELEAFSYSVSHDLRAPLRTIGGFMEAILEERENRLNAESVQHAQKIISASVRMNRLIDGLLDFSRVSKREMHVEPIDLQGLARDIVAELGVEGNGRNVKITIEPMRYCLGDPTLVRQVVVNLLSNAVKYSRERNPAIITMAEQPGEKSQRVYMVRDNGAGFDMQHATRLFQVFERLHDARRFEGTGIGLATSKRIIERHGGRIWAEASPGRGAAFFFTLPPADRNNEDVGRQHLIGETASADRSVANRPEI